MSLGADEEEVDGDEGKEVRELGDDVRREGGFGAGAEDEDADGGRGARVASVGGGGAGVEGLTEGCW